MYAGLDKKRGQTMGNVYIFRGKAAVGKSTLSDMIAKRLSIPVIRKDDIVDALKTTQDIDKRLINNTVCYNILYKIIQTNLNLGADFILDIALGDRQNAKAFFERLDFKNNNALWFFVVCNNEDEWKKRHIERIENPLPNQSFKSFEHVLEHYKNADVNPFENEHVIDSSETLEKSFDDVLKIISSFDKKECVL